MEWCCGLVIGIWDERFSALEESWELDFEQPSEVGFEKAQLSGASEAKLGM
jgi:hypothetical protein